ncbi:MAG: hypothetical protein KF895_16740 [Parvibaculum sp.]|nr:hypothetical protein [Parvibaculum sp.]
MTGKIWPAIFWLAALYNFAAGLPPILGIGLPPAGLAPEHLLTTKIAGLLICTFGIGYALVALGIPGTRHIVTLGLIGKIGVCLLVLLYMSALPPEMPLLAAGDFLFVLAFAAWLHRTRGQNT